MQNIHADKLLILDFGSQYTQLIAKRVRELGVYCEIFPYDVAFSQIQTFAPKGIILSGGPDTATTNTSPSADPQIFDLACPILGICYGMQWMADHLGGRVMSAEKREYGYAQLTLSNHCRLLSDIEDHANQQGQALLDVWMSHGDHVIALPEGFISVASTDNAPLAAMADDKRAWYGLQFHPEVTHTSQGSRILQRFIETICNCQCLWRPSDIIADKIAQIQQQVGEDSVLLALSGGVDSSVVAALMHKAIGDKLVCVFVNNGLLRLGEADQVMTTFHKHFGMKVIRVNAEQRFLQALAGVIAPEQKRKIIGNLFIKVFEEESKKLGEVQWLAQGTIYPDVIESAGAKTGKAKVIKSHHNVGGLPEKMSLKLIEPLRELFKDEVRNIGLELGLAKALVYRHPFPGPGLGVRILGEVKKSYADVLRQADAIFIEELYKNDWYDKVSQAFTVFLPVRSVGVVGDNRQYDYVVALRAVETVDFMTARWAHLPYDLLDHISRRIINEVSGISRVTYDISGKPPATIEWE